MVRKFILSPKTRQLIPILIPTLVVSFISAVKLSGAEDYDNGITYIEDPGIEYETHYDTVYVLGKNSVKVDVDFESVNVKKADVNISYSYKTSTRAHDFIKSFEKCKLNAYHIKGEKYNTIGWGHYLQKEGEGNIKRISQARADELFREDIAWVDKAVTDMLNDVNSSYKWPQGIVDGLGSLVYNCGERGVRTTEFYRRLQNCRFENGQINKSDIDFTLAAVKNTRCTKPGHYKRRAAEYAMMIAG